MLAPIKTLLTSIVDYAGLFPPAKLDMRTAMANYADDRSRNHAWMLDRFVLPATRLPEFVQQLPGFTLPHWSLSVIISGNWAADLEQVRSLQNQPNVTVTALEFAPCPATEIEPLMAQVPEDIECFFEIPWSENLDSYLEQLQQTGSAAKIRTGGVTAEAFPSAEQLAQFMAAFIEAKVPFKATAGLHHPLPAIHALTYEPDSPTARMHGFLNVALAAALLDAQKIDLAAAQELLQMTTLDRCQITDDRITWNDRSLNRMEIAAARKFGFRSFGSCSFREPIADLKELHLL